MRFKTDENLPTEAADILTAAGYDALTIHDQHMVGDADPHVASVCRVERRVLVTLDLDFSDIRAYPPEDYSGIVVLRPKNQAKSSVLVLMAQLVAVLAVEPLEGNLWILQESGLRIREGKRG